MSGTAGVDRLLGGMIATATTFAGMAHADTVSIFATRDATLYESNDGNAANGAGRYLFAGRTNQNLVRRALTCFDVAAVLPNGAEITSVRLIMNLSQANSSGLARSVSLHRALQGWTTGATDPTDTESLGAPTLIGDCTWTHSTSDGAGGGTPWQIVGGDFATTASASVATQALGLYTWTSAGLLDDVRNFAQNPSQNLGWFILGDESAAGTARRFDSADSGAEGGIVPRLEIEFATVPTPGPFALLAAAALVVSRRRRG
jgi:MYXO-CTERM domain-containing protein